jgi:nitrogen fixation protein FixH
MPFDAETSAKQPGPLPVPLPPKPLTGRGVLLSLGLFFGTVLAANGALTFAALRTLPGGELANSYDDSQTYNTRIAGAHLQEERGWRAQATTRAEAGGARVSLEITDRSGAPVAGLQVLARFEHPADRRADKEAALASRGNGYEGIVPSLHAGAWTLIIEARQDGKAAYLSRNRIILAY